MQNCLQRQAPVRSKISEMRDFEVFIPLVAVAMIFGIPIVAILTTHQRKMAELIHGNRQQTPNQDLAPIYHELKNLRDSVNSLALNVDSLKSEIRSQSTVQDRLNVGE